METGNQMLQSLLSGLIASVFTFFLGVLYTNIQRKKDYKMKYRSSLKLEELYNCKYDLSNTGVEKNSKIIITKNYEEIKKFIETNHGEINNNNISKVFNKEIFRMNFLKVKNIGPGIIINLNCKIEYKYEGSKGVEVNYAEFNLETFEIGEEIYVCLENLNTRLYSDNLSIIEYKFNFEFSTIAGESIHQVKKYYSKDDKKFIQNSILYKNILGKWKTIYESNISPVLWDFVKDNDR
ncbi:hypothetical protein ACV3VX_04830 [Clostridium perfringens]